MKNTKLSSLCFFIIMLSLVACENPGEDKATDLLPTLPDDPFSYDIGIIPTGFSNLDNTPHDNQMTDAGATLGRVLFYDTKLSVTNNVSCGSCHKQTAGFADSRAKSIGFRGEETHRNSMTILNARFKNTYFWDNSVNQLEEQVLMPVSNHVEMGLENMEFLVRKLEAAEYYPELFEKAFGTPEITETKIRKALSQFLRSVVSMNSKYDIGEETNFSNFSEEEKLGHDVFFGKAKCGDCHRNMIFAYYQNFPTANIGLDENYADNGMFGITGEEIDKGHFLVPSLRNIVQTPPYMHDGRFNTLEEVIEHYNSGIKNHPNLSWNLREQTGEPVRLNLDAVEKKALVAFLNTLTDDTFVSQEKFSDPFK